MENCVLDLASFVGSYIPSIGVTSFMRDLDGAYLRSVLEIAGYVVITNRDTGRNGEVITQCGYRVSTNGYVSRI